MPRVVIGSAEREALKNEIAHLRRQHSRPRRSRHFRCRPQPLISRAFLPERRSFFGRPVLPPSLSTAHLL